MVTKGQMIDAFVDLGKLIMDRPPELEAVIHRSSIHNPWFTKENISSALGGIARQFLQRDALEKWMDMYPVPVSRPQTIGLIMAGNIPAVGFHDLLAVLASGHRAAAKLSEKDPYLMAWMVGAMGDSLRERVSIVEKLQDFDAVIATGSNNSARYFRQYFGRYPHVIRKNRNSVAVLDGSETTEQLGKLANDLFSYFGLGCRNVSKIYIPEGYDFEALVAAMEPYRDLANHSKYKNNIDYNAAIHILNKVPNISLPHITLVERDEIISRIGSLHYAHYSNLAQLRNEFAGLADEIQCIVTGLDFEHGRIPVVGFGESQCPALTDYADGVDTMQFLSSL